MNDDLPNTLLQIEPEPKKSNRKRDYVALISVNDTGGGALLEWGDLSEPWQKEDHAQMDMLGEYDFGVPIGIYTASMSGCSCGGSKCNGYPCGGDCFETEWHIGEAVVVVK